MARKASRKAEKRDVSIDADDRLAMTKALNFILERSRRAQDQIVDLIEETEPFLEFHGERPAEADLHWRIVRNLNELLALFARFEIRALHTLQPGLSEEGEATAAARSLPLMAPLPLVRVDADICVQHLDAFMALTQKGLYVAMTKDEATEMVLVSADEYRRLSRT